MIFGLVRSPVHWVEIAPSKVIEAGNAKSRHGTERCGYKTQNGEDLEYSLLLPLMSVVWHASRYGVRKIGVLNSNYLSITSW